MPASGRRSRLAPLPVPLAGPLPDHSHAPAILAVGAFLKNTIALAADGEAFTSQHIGDLETPRARAAVDGAIRDLSELFDIHPEWVACDLHPDYPSTRYARESGLPALGQVRQARIRLRLAMVEVLEQRLEDRLRQAASAGAMVCTAAQSFLAKRASGARAPTATIRKSARGR